jgi:hypothetical protein
MNREPIPGTHEPGFVEQPIRSVGLPDIVYRLNPGSRGLVAFTMGDCTILRGLEPAGVNGEVLLHLTISHPDRHPTWDEIKVVRYRLLPLDRCFGMLLPPPDEYVNVPQQDHVFHLWESTDPRQPWSAR